MGRKRRIRGRQLEKQLKKYTVVEENTRGYKNFYRLNDGSWISVDTIYAGSVTRPREAHITARIRSEQAIPELAKILQKVKREQRYVIIEPYSSAVVGKERSEDAKRIIACV